MKSLLLLSFIIVGGMASHVSAQCTIENKGHGCLLVPSQYELGQSFTASCSGNLDYVAFIACKSDTMEAGQLEIFLGDTATGTAAYTQNFTKFYVLNDSLAIIHLTSSFSVVTGSMYTFIMGTSVNIKGKATGDPYTGGRAYEFRIPAPDGDFDFEIGISKGTGLATNTLESNTLLSPNPTSSLLNVQIPRGYSSVSVEILDISGRKVGKRQIFQGTNAQLDVSDLPTGVYFIRLESPEAVAVKRFMKN